MGADPMGGLSPNPMGGVIVNPGHFLAQTLKTRLPKVFNALNRIPEKIAFTETVPVGYSPSLGAFGVTYPYPTAGSATRDSLIYVSPSKAAPNQLDTVLAHEALHALYRAKQGLEYSYGPHFWRALPILSKAMQEHPPGYINWLLHSVYKGDLGHAALETLADRIVKKPSSYRRQAYTDALKEGWWNAPPSVLPE